MKCLQLPAVFHFPLFLIKYTLVMFLMVQCIQLFFIKCTFTLTVNPPEIIRHPESTSVATGAPAVFTVEATGDKLQFQWQKNGKDIDQDKSRLHCSHTDNISTLCIEHVEKSDKGHYTCFINNLVEKSGITSQEAELNVCEFLFFFFCLCVELTMNFSFNFVGLVCGTMHVHLSTKLHAHNNRSQLEENS